MEVFKDNTNRLKKTAAVLGVTAMLLTGCNRTVEAKAVPAEPTPTIPAQQVDAVPEAAITPDLSAELTTGWQQALAGYKGDIDIAVYDNLTGQTVEYSQNAGSATFDSASTIKLPIAVEATLQGQAKGQMNTCEGLSVPTPMSCDQAANAIPMIENSDNNATETLWEKIGSQTAVQSLLDQAAPGAKAGSSWGNSQFTAKQLLAIENLVAYPGKVLAPESAAAITELMGKVESDQRWGIGAGVPAGVTFENKNGWLDDAETNDRFSNTTTWVTNSTGHVHGTAPDGKQVDYTETILSRGNANYPAGQAILNKVATVTSTALTQ